MEFKGTKGKWFIDTELNHINKYGSKVRVISSDNDEHMIEIYGNKDEDDFNAQLISCAPEMLEMLQYFVDENMLSITGEEMAKQLIKKATEV